MKLSIIVPIYNVEEYLSRCIDSILAQTFTTFELILVDDGSPDRCGAIIEEYAQKDPRIVTIHQKNQGVSAARNAGLHIARGKYIGFVDPDDYISPDRYEVAIDALENNHAQLGICDFTDVDDYVEPVLVNTVENLQVLNQHETAEALFHIPPTIYGSVLNKLFLRDLITEKFDTSAKYCEDNLFLLRYIFNIERTVWVKASLYYVYKRPGSATRSGIQKIVESLAVREQMCEIVKSSSMHDIYELSFYNYIDSCVNMLFKLDKNMKERKEVLNRIKINLPHILRSNTIPWKEKLLCVSFLFR